MADIIEIHPCPDCSGEIRIFTHIARGAFARCQVCKKEYDICGMDQIPTYHGCRIRKSTVNKIIRMWNRRTDHGKR